MFFVNSFDSKKIKIHDFRQLEQDVDYFVDFTESGKVATLTTPLKIEIGEKIILDYKQKPLTYYIKDIEFYWNDESIKTLMLVNP